ncbi:uncharacterized protein LOC124304951 [Neodiprion virginianus]|uniref:uncharacterized protein LOC124304951 n=1 Tax=Neodiprion virginianus TaxID=2961670 RepID=UPI001EE6DEF1|nr:uncharacterized protein LOC124304951 [Neodiprion virginianus]
MVENLRKTGQANISAGAVQARIFNLDKYWEKFENQHEVLLNKFKDELKKHDYATFSSLVEEEYMSQRGMLMDFATKLTGETRNSSASTQPQQSNGRASLPRIQLPMFSGNYEDWPSFRDLFKSLIDQNASISEVEKLHYLKASLKGEASLLIKTLSITAENYKQAWNTLSGLYENKRALIRSCLTKFTSIPKAKAESANELQRIFHGMISTCSSLDAIGRPIGQHEDLYVFLVVELFDNKTRRDWEASIAETTEPPTYTHLRNFLERRIQTLEAIQQPKGEQKSPEPSPRWKNTHHAQNNNGKKKASEPEQEQRRSAPTETCIICNQAHYIMFCPTYKDKPARERLSIILQHNRCTNCLGKHKHHECPSKKTCRTCSEGHHTTLHDALAAPKPATSANCLIAKQRPSTRVSVLLATARIRVADRFGNLHHARALIDQGSDTSMITERLAQRLHITRTKASIAICGVGGVQTATAKGKVELKVTARHKNTTIVTTALILPKLTLYGNNVEASRREWNHIKGLDLADPDFEASDPIDVLLGADIYAQIMDTGLRKGGRNQPIAQKTIFGWILSGTTSASNASTNTTVSHHCSTRDSLSSMVRRFWEQEELPNAPPSLTPDERICEETYAIGHSRTPEGRYIVRLPTSSKIMDLSDTRRAAERSLNFTFKRFTHNKGLEQHYHEFMSTYEAMKHMEVAEQPKPTSNVCYLPHHGVWRESSTTTPLRAVFNGSCLTHQGISLNHILLKGENLLPALSDVLLRWRTHRFVIAADIEKMYRQILVHPDDRDLQRILWKTEEDQDPREYRLNTVTYGLACAPFLAIRTIRQLAHDEQANFPLGASILQRDIYVDDILTGADNQTQLLNLQKELREICMAGGFPLKKWMSNDSTLLTHIPESDRLVKGNMSWAPTEETHSTLGLQWSQQSDTFLFTVQPTTAKAITKRSILSQAAQLFDPLGWLTPVTTRAKITIQSTWLINAKWDDPLPQHISQDWREFHDQWTTLSNIRIPRWLIRTNKIELHGFSDASEQAYAAVLYLRALQENGRSETSLIAAKSKVAPLKQVSLPRLELCAAHLLTKLAHHTLRLTNWNNITTYLWTDSTVTLGWIQAPPRRWKTYVANRVAEIQTLLPEAKWNHIPSQHNPADCASRGLSPRDLLTHQLWWKGPEFLSNDEKPPRSNLQTDLTNLPEGRSTAHAATAREPPTEPEMLSLFSSYSKLLRITAWCRRWLPQNHNHENLLSPAEIIQAEIAWLKIIQQHHWREELRHLTTSSIKKGSSLISLTPYLDDKGILRVGGRLKHSLLSLDEKHPIILPYDSKFSSLLIDHLHTKTLHGGVQLVLGTLRQRYWIPRGRNLIKSRIRQCVICTRWRAEPPQQLMGNLPRSRVTPARPFQFTGVDYAGPIALKTSPGRGTQDHQGLFRHLRMHGDQSCALRHRFRLFHASLHSSFKTIHLKKRTLHRALQRPRNSLNWASLGGSTHQQLHTLAGSGQAAVKSTKFHLRRVIGDASLTYEEISTVLSQIEACLNSRPLSALTDDPDDVSALTPGHFLIGAPLNALPEPTLADTPTSRLSRWQQLTQMRDHFWTRWSREYIQSLIPRNKWLQARDNIKKGHLCLIRNEITPPSKWPLGRIIETLPGNDGLIRVAVIKTATTTLTRPINKIVLLPIAAEE